MNTPSDRRIVLGLVVQPFLAFGLGVGAAAVRLSTETGSIQGGTTGVLVSSGILLGVYVIVASSVAYFLILWLRDRGRVTFGRALITGFVLGSLPVVLIGIAARAGDERAAAAPLVSWVPGLALASFLGLAGAGLFWLIACRPAAPRPNALHRA